MLGAGAVESTVFGGAETAEGYPAGKSGPHSQALPGCPRVSPPLSPLPPLFNCVGTPFPPFSFSQSPAPGAPPPDQDLGLDPALQAAHPALGLDLGDGESSPGGGSANQELVEQSPRYAVRRETLDSLGLSEGAATTEVGMDMASSEQGDPSAGPAEEETFEGKVAGCGCGCGPAFAPEHAQTHDHNLCPHDQSQGPCLCDLASIASLQAFGSPKGPSRDQREREAETSRGSSACYDWPATPEDSPGRCPDEAGEACAMQLHGFPAVQIHIAEQLQHLDQLQHLERLQRLEQLRNWEQLQRPEQVPREAWAQRPLWQRPATTLPLIPAGAACRDLPGWHDSDVAAQLFLPPPAWPCGSPWGCVSTTTSPSSAAWHCAEEAPQTWFPMALAPQSHVVPIPISQRAPVTVPPTSAPAAPTSSAATTAGPCPVGGSTDSWPWPKTPDDWSASADMAPTLPRAPGVPPCSGRQVPRGGAAAAAASAMRNLPNSYSHEEGGTAVVMRNLPNNYSREELRSLLDRQGFFRAYNFFYLPIDFQTGAALGYAFVNLVSRAQADEFLKVFRGFTHWDHSSRKACWIDRCRPESTGLRDLIERHRNNPVMNEAVSDDWKPILLQDGVRVRFPSPTQQLAPPRAPWGRRATTKAWNSRR